jgi:hypothetical protein
MVRIDARTYWNWVFQNQQVVIDVIRKGRCARWPSIQRAV